MDTQAVVTSEDLREQVRQKLKVEFGIKLHERSQLMKIIDEYARSKSCDMFDAYVTETRGEIVYTDQANKWKQEYIPAN